MPDTAASASRSRTDGRSAPELAGDVVRAVIATLRSTARILGAEARGMSRRVRRRLALLVVSSVAGAAGAVVLLGGISVLVEEVSDLPLWAALLVVGASALALAALGVIVALRRLGRVDLAFPETVAEFEKDLVALGWRGSAP